MSLDFACDGNQQRRRNWTMVITGLILWIVVFLYAVRWVPDSYVADARDYFRLGQELWKEGFSILNYPQSIRGYFLPMIIGGLARLSEIWFHDQYTLWVVFGSGLCVLLNGFIIPFLCLPKEKLGTNRWILGAVCANGLFLFYWSELILYTLSDLPALMFYGGMIACVKICQSLKGKGISFLVGCVGGILAYAAYNTRTIYLFAIIACVILALVLRGTRKNFPFWIGAALGVVATAVPQMMINHHLYGNYSMLLNTNSGGYDSLFVFQLKYGLEMPRYETHFGKKWVYPEVRAKYIDQLGHVLMRDSDFTSVKEYIIWLFTHLLEACGIYCKHLFSGLTPFYRSIFVRDLAPKAHVFLINCAVWITGLLAMKEEAIRNTGAISKAIIKRAAIYTALLVMPAVFAIPSSVETRFFLPAYCIIYVYVTMGVDYRALLRYARVHWFEAALFVIGFFLVWCMVATDLMGSLEHAVLDWSGNVWPRLN